MKPRAHKKMVSLPTDTWAGSAGMTMMLLCLVALFAGACTTALTVPTPPAAQQAAAGSTPADVATPAMTAAVMTGTVAITGTEAADGTAPVPADLSNLVIRMEKTACEGPCPVYSVEIHGDGTVLYNGRTCVNVVGEQTAHMDPAQVEALVRLFYQNDFFSLQDSYVEDVQDIPSTTIQVSLPDQTKQVFVQVYDQSKAPEAFERIESHIEEIANLQQWISGDGTPASCP